MSIINGQSPNAKNLPSGQVRQSRNGAGILLPGQNPPSLPGIRQMYDEAHAVADELAKAEASVVRLTDELEKADSDLLLAKAQAERNVSQGRKGGEYSLAPAEQGRERIFVLARAKDSNYQALLKAKRDLAVRLRLQEAAANHLQDKLRILLAGLRVGPALFDQP